LLRDTAPHSVFIRLVPRITRRSPQPPPDLKLTAPPHDWAPRPAKHQPWTSSSSRSFLERAQRNPEPLCRDTSERRVGRVRRSVAQKASRSFIKQALARVLVEQAHGFCKELSSTTPALISGCVQTFVQRAPRGKIPRRIPPASQPGRHFPVPKEPSAKRYVEAPRDARIHSRASRANPATRLRRSEQVPANFRAVCASARC
jgi:hypothetical protein